MDERRPRLAADGTTSQHTVIVAQRHPRRVTSSVGPAHRSVDSTVHGMHTLHVTNGDHAAAAIAGSGLSGTVLPWRDVLHDGPVPDDSDREAFNRTRARFFDGRGWGIAADVHADLVARDATLDRLTADDHVMLWFEPDLYDQLQLVQLLARLHRIEAARRPQVSIAPADCFLGPLEPHKFIPLFDARRAIDAADLEAGMRMWAAFTAAEPTELLYLADAWETSVPARTYAADDRVRLPYLGAAMRRLLEEYPDVEHGLSRTERQLCELLLVEEVSIGQGFERTHSSAEPWAWLGDASFAWYVERLSLAPEPLVTNADGSRITAPHGEGDRRVFWSRVIKLTPFGRDVLRGRRDALDSNGIDRWIGGVHLTHPRAWRWDPAGRRLVRGS
jgi:hypothetical protein